MPKMGESIMEGTILKWLKKVGDPVAKDENILNIATDKVDAEVPSNVAGVLSEILFNEGDVVPVGKAIAIIETDVAVNSTSSPSPSVPSETKIEAISATPAPITASETNGARATVEAVQSAVASGRFYTPVVLNIARGEGISMDELTKVKGTGMDGRVTKATCSITFKIARKASPFPPRPLHQLEKLKACRLHRNLLLRITPSSMTLHAPKSCKWITCANSSPSTWFALSKLRRM